MLHKIAYLYFIKRSFHSYYVDEEYMYKSNVEITNLLLCCKFRNCKAVIESIIDFAPIKSL